jgi:hypothetical protein
LPEKIPFRKYYCPATHLLHCQSPLIGPFEINEEESKTDVSRDRMTRK